MIDTDKYEGHYKGPWAYQYGDVVKLVYPNESSPSLDADQRLIIDAPLLLAEIKRLRKGIWDALYLFQEGGNPKMSDKKRLETICEFLVELIE